MEGIRNLFIGISICISLTRIFENEVIGGYFISLFLGLAALIEIFERRKKKPQL